MPVVRLVRAFVDVQFGGFRAALHRFFGHFESRPRFFWQATSHSAFGTLGYKRTPFMEERFELAAVLAFLWRRTLGRIAGSEWNAARCSHWQGESPNRGPRENSSLRRRCRIDCMSQLFVLPLYRYGVIFLIGVIIRNRNGSQCAYQRCQPPRQTFVFPRFCHKRSRIELQRRRSHSIRQIKGERAIYSRPPPCET